MNKNSDFKICPNCGATIPKKALACPECGSDENTGWSDKAELPLLILDVPDSELTSAKPKRRNKIFYAGVAFVIIVSFLTSVTFLTVRASVVLVTAIVGAFSLIRLVSMRKRHNEDRLFQELLRMVMGDRNTAKRLITMEQRRAPGISTRESILNAIERLRRDRQ